MDACDRSSDFANAHDNSPPLAGGGRGRGREPNLTPIAKKLRQNMTYPERLLWSRLRAKQQRFKFRRQQPIGDYVADFYCSEARLVVELDGQSHRHTFDVDATRQAWLEQQGIQVVRFSNDQVIEDVDAVVKAVWVACRDRIGGDDV